MKRKVFFVTIIIGLLCVISGCTKKITYSFETFGGTEVSKVTTSEGVLVEPLTTREGFTFKGWFLDINCSGERLTFPYRSSKDITLYAKWEALPKVVTFESNGGNSLLPISGTVSVEPVPTKGSDIFLGWYTTSDFQGSRVVFPYTPVVDTILYAKWESVKTYTVTFRTYGGIAVAPMVTNYIENEPVTTLANDVFLGWYLNSDYSGERVNFPLTVTENMTLHAKWQNSDVPEEFEVTFETNGGVAVPSYTGEVLEIAPTTTKENANFVGWYLDAECTRIARFPLTILDDMTLYAKWEPKQEITPEEIETLREYFRIAYENYSRTFTQTVYNGEGVLEFVGSNYYMFDDNAIRLRYAGMDEDGNYLRDENGDYIYFTEFIFYRADENAYYYYYVSANGSYIYNNTMYACYVSTDPYTDGPMGEGILDALYLAKLSQLDPTQFYCYDNKWYAKDDYINEAAKLIIGENQYASSSSGGYESVTETFKSFYLTFDASGKITKVYASSDMFFSEGSVSSGVIQYKYQLEYEFEIGNYNNVALPDESVMYENSDRPSGLYPVLDDNEYRDAFKTDGLDYTVAQLQEALTSLNRYTAFYTLAANFNTETFLYSEQLIQVDGNKGLVQLLSNSKPDYYYYDPNTGATFYMIGNNVYCDQYSYKNKYEYNQYLLEDQAIAVNVKIPTSNLPYLDMTGFTFNSEEKYFEFKGRNIKEMGQLIFGDADYDLATYKEIEEYVYIRIYMNNNQVSKIVAATRLDVYDEDIYEPFYSEYFIKEVVFVEENNNTVTLPISTNSLCAPGEAKENGSLNRLIAAFQNMALNYTYSDVFRFIDTDEIYGASDDLYKYDGAKAMIMDNYYYYVNKVPYYYYAYNKTVYKANDYWIDWGTPILNMLQTDWFYEGKDGSYYCKPEYLEECSKVIARFSGSPYYLDGQSAAYTKTVHLDFVQINLSYSSVSNIYYSGRMTTKGTNGQYDQIFCGIGRFTNVGSTSVTLPSTITNADTSYPDIIIHTLDAPTDFDMTGEAVLQIELPPHVIGYKAYVYLNGVLVNGSPFLVTNGTNFKELLEEGTYTLKLVAYGDPTYYLDSDLSKEEVEFVVSRFLQLDMPKNVKADPATQTLTFDLVEHTTRYVVEVWKGGSRLLLETIEVGNYDLSMLEDGTYNICVYAAGDNVNYRDSEKVTVVLTVGESLFDEFLEVLNGSYYLRHASSLSTTIDGKRYEYTTTYWYDAATNRAKLVIKVIDSSNDFDYRDPYQLITIYYYQELTVDKAKYVIETRDNETPNTFVLDNVKKPHTVFKTLTRDQFTEEVNGTLTKFIYTYTDTTNTVLFENTSLLEEIFYSFDVTFNYTEIRFTCTTTSAERYRIDMIQTTSEGETVKQTARIDVIEDNFLTGAEWFSE